MDTGYRSVEVNVTNDTRGNLVVQSPEAGQNCSWIEGEQPAQGNSLSQFSALTWGVATSGADASVSGQVQLNGLGSSPVTISFSNNEAGGSSCTVAPSDAVRGSVAQVDTGEASHSQFNVQLLPV